MYVKAACRQTPGDDPDLGPIWGLFKASGNLHYSEGKVRVPVGNYDFARDPRFPDATHYHSFVTDDSEDERYMRWVWWLGPDAHGEHSAHLLVTDAAVFVMDDSGQTVETLW